MTSLVIRSLRLKYEALITLFLIILSVSIAGCQKEQPQPTASSGFSKAFGERKGGCEHVDFTVANVGQLHNESLLTLLDGLTGEEDPTDALFIIKNRFLNADYHVPEGLRLADGNILTRENYNHFAFQAIEEVHVLAQCNFDLGHCSNSILYNSPSASYIVEIFEKIDSLETYRDINSFYDGIDNIRIRAGKTLNCGDLDLIIGTTEVAKYSAELWMPVDKGGEGLYDRMVNPEHRNRSLENMVKGDVAASAGYWTCLGVGGMIGLGVPGANEAILGGWALAAAWGSGTSLFGF
jgi:hypothetical protein